MNVIDIFRSLYGLNSEQIKEIISKENIKGKIGSNTQCVFARYVRLKTEQEYFAVGIYTAHDDFGVYNVPRNISKFIEEFENNLYPNLSE